MDVLSAAIGATQDADADAAAAVAAVVAAASLSSNNTSSNSSPTAEIDSSSRQSSGASRLSSGGGGGGGGAEVDDMEDDEEGEAVPPSADGTGGQSASGAGMASGAIGAPPPLNIPHVTVLPAVDPAAAEAHAKLQMQRQDIEDGKHPRMEEEKARQGDLKRRRVEIATDHNRLLLVNVDELREAEIRDSEIQTKVALEKTQEALLDDVHQRIRKARVDGGLVPATVSASAIAAEAGGEKGDKADTPAAGSMFLAGRKRARLMPTRTFEKVTPEGVLAKAEARRIRTVTLSDIEMRKDFQAIILDWRERAKKYLSTYNNSHWTKVSVNADSFRVRGVTFSKGDPVVVTSRVTGEEFHGEITIVKPKAVFLSLYGGVKTRIFVDHISTGRLTVARADVKSSGS